ncbi:nucleotide disphospho-sugar-binding domain-containing protein [Streptomyces sp. NRRL F-5126]|uniref:nucleotide disphospho-sugar-binding domain-containing protein n=1 Tax=Streptomyces sp. NRRL F-5126 TaxID=1463857 RepID=UPI0004CC1C39|nr:nucleotide disphospho-sugar-binding domain-containing protein [Streptomyces sp. NRRL F-5126]
MRVLIITTPVSTHFAPLVPLAWALRGAGHEVLVAGQPDVVDAARASGLSGHVVGEAFHAGELMALGLPDGLRPIQAAGRPGPPAFAGAVRPWTAHTRYTVGGYLEFARHWRPDLVLADRLEYGALIVGGALGVPVVQHRWGVDPVGEVAWAAGARSLRGVCERAGLAGGLPRPDLVLDPCPPGFQDPSLTPGQPIRFVPNNGSGTLPDWALEPCEGRRVCVSLGRLTLAMNGMGLLRSIVGAFEGLDGVEGVVTVDDAYADAVGEVPGNVRVVPPVPLDLVLDGCAAVVHHGGSGTQLTATAFGLPQVVLPGHLDTFVVGDRVAACGAGVTVDDAAAQDDSAAVREAIRAVLDDPRYELGARRLRAAMETQPTPADTVGRLEALARDRTLRRAAA